MEIEATVDTTVGTLFDGFDGACAAKAERPILELVLVLVGELLGSGYIGRFADHLIGFADVVAEGII